MNVLWIVSGILVVATTIEGVRQGVVRRAAELAGLVAVFLFASRLADLLAPLLDEHLSMDSSIAFYVSWAAVLIGGVIAVRLAASGLRKIVHLTLVGWLDRVGGGVLGFAFGLVLASCLFVGARAASGDIREELEGNEPAQLLLHLAPSLYDLGHELFGGERFFDMIREHAEPATRRLRDSAALSGAPGHDGRA